MKSDISEWVVNNYSYTYYLVKTTTAVCSQSSQAYNYFMIHFVLRHSVCYVYYVDARRNVVPSESMQNLFSRKEAIKLRKNIAQHENLIIRETKQT